jgi:selenocysteine lyase/cysteine desulfurase
MTSATAFPSALTQSSWSRQLEQALNDASLYSADQLSDEEELWYYIQQAFTVLSSIINLNNGGVSPAPMTVQDAMKCYYDYSHEAPSYYVWRILDQERESLRANRAGIADCSPEEIAINRNASEGFETIIFGLPLQLENLRWSWERSHWFISQWAIGDRERMLCLVSGKL